MTAEAWPLPGSRGLGAFFRRVVDRPAACPGSALKAHQRVIAKFLSPESPYRGLLAVHGVGAGKTLSATAVIAAAAFAPGAPTAWAVLPASLKDSFLAELSKERALAEFECGSWAAARDGWARSADGTPFHELADADRADVAALVRARVTSSVRFLSLNGLPANAVLAPGQKVKVVRYGVRRS